MLVLTRKRDEEVRATVPGSLTKSGEPIAIYVTLIEIRGERARLGFNAISEVKFDRMEYITNGDHK